MDKEIKNIIEKVNEDKKILALAVFGSSLKGKGRDIDICIFLDKKYSNLEMSKKKLTFQKEAHGYFDIQIFQQLPIYIRIRIIKEGEIVFCKNHDVLYDIAFSTIKEFGFYKKLYDLYLQEVKNG